MNMRGKTQTEIFGTMTLEQYNQHIQQYAKELDVEVEIVHSNIEGEAINFLYNANDLGFDAALINPAGFSRGYPALVAAINQVKFPVIEVHMSNPAARETFRHLSVVSGVADGTIAGFGLLSYRLALRAVAEMTGDAGGAPGRGSGPGRGGGAE